MPHSTFHSTPKHKQTFVPRLEKLEERACPTAVTLVGDNLRIMGDNRADNVRLMHNIETDTIRVTFDQGRGGMQTRTFAAADVNAINVSLKAGADRFFYKLESPVEGRLALRVDLGGGKDNARMNFGPNAVSAIANVLAGQLRGTKDGDAVRVDALDYHGPLAGFLAKLKTASTGVYVNGVEMTRALLNQFRKTYGVRPPAGRYWYDKISGAAGLEGQGTGAFLPAGLQLGGALRADASRGTSEIFINGRELADGEVAFLQRLTATQIPQGRYFVDGAGNAGLEGGPVLVNLVELARQQGYTSSGGGALSSYDRTGVSVLSDGSFTGILLEDGGSVTFG